jgi:hypothetical protein
MNRDHTLFHLREAAEELQQTIGEIEGNPTYDQAEFWVAMQDLYHHLNTAWNARNESPERVAVTSEEDFLRWRQFPEDLGLGD